MLSITNKKICIIGAKRSGRALCELVLRLKGLPKVSDKGEDHDFRKWAKENNIEYELNQHSQAFIENSDIIVLSPGVSIHSQTVQWAKQKNIPVLGEIEFAFQFCQKPVIAVTGSNGKTTVSTLIHEVLVKANLKSRLCGNIGEAFTLYCLDKTVDYFVLEVSSFQLESILDPLSPFRQESKNGSFSFCGFKPFMGVFLNFSDNHLDRHKNIDEYFDAKKRLFINQDHNDFILLSEQNDRLKGLVNQVKGKVIFFDRREAKKEFDTENPNQLAVYAAADVLNISKDIARDVFNAFHGVEHRLEWVRSIGGIDFINDSKATTAEAGRWALNNIRQPVVMICGGKDKNIDFSVLEKIVGEKVKKMIVFGEAHQKLKTAFEKFIEVDVASDLKDAVYKARERSVKGDCVVLSPMCASFDMFKDYEERGKVFKQIVKELN